ncbi:MAG: hypothetical protein JNL11_06445 [Bdellovibrionaceae bacterium]|nr:hypothetical protein [Pseudobdellovibrionaceae bacterium]
MIQTKIYEIEKITRLIAAFKRAPYQRNRIYESDSEILDFGLEKNIAITSDILCEEIEWGLISDPYVMGWVNVTASLSDLAAVAAEPLGVLVGLSHSQSTSQDFLSRFWQGTREALDEHQTFLLGGDTNISNSFLVSCTGIGQRAKSTLLNRKGINDGDLVYLSGPVGMGTAVGFANFVVKPKSATMASQIEPMFKPKARLSEAHVIAKFASSCIDTSDGLLAAVDFLSQLNQIQMELTLSKTHFHSICWQLVDQLKIPWILFSSIHLGEFELLFTIPPQNQTAFEMEMRQKNFSFLKIGQIRSAFSQLHVNGCAIDLNPIRNLLNDLKDPSLYLGSQQRWASGLAIPLI